MQMMFSGLCSDGRNLNYETGLPRELTLERVEPLNHAAHDVLRAKP